MNCQNCNTEIDYRFLTNCTHCNCEVQGISVPQIAPPDPLPPASGQTWGECLVNVAYVLVSSVVGMISGAVVVYFSAVIAFSIFLSPLANPSAECSRGMALGMLSILLGAFLGTVGGSLFALKRPLCKSAAR